MISKPFQGVPRSRRPLSAGSTALPDKDKPHIPSSWQTGCYIPRARGHAIMHLSALKRIRSLLNLIKSAFLMVVLLLLVLMGVYNRGLVDFNLPPVMNG